MFVYRRKVHFYETDLMGIVHHSNYLRFLEEARVSWAVHYGLIKFDDPDTASHFAVYETRVRHLRPSRFGDDLEIDVEARRRGIRIVFQYRIRNKEEVVCLGQTEHVSLDHKLKLMKLSNEMLNILEKSAWTETWL